MKEAGQGSEWWVGHSMEGLNLGLLVQGEEDMKAVTVDLSSFFDFALFLMQLSAHGLRAVALERLVDFLHKDSQLCR